MKKLFFILPALLFISACDPKGSEASDPKNDSLIGVIDEQNTSLNEFINSFNEIESKLDSVAAKQKIITLYTFDPKHEIKGNKNMRINAEIAAINDLMNRNRKELDDLNRKSKSAKTKNVLLEKTIATLTIQISQKDYELCELNLKLKTMDTKIIKLVSTVDSLSEQNYIKDFVIDYQASDLRTAFYIVGEEKDLVDEKVIDKKGGFLGIGKTSTLSENFDNTMFTYVDIIQTNVIPVNGKDIKIITSHPADSYTIENDMSKKNFVKDIVITNAQRFWSASKYLVVIKK